MLTWPGPSARARSSWWQARRQEVSMQAYEFLYNKPSIGWKRIIKIYTKYRNALRQSIYLWGPNLHTTDVYKN